MDLELVRWHVTLEADEEFVGLSSPVVGDGRVFVYARYLVGPFQVGNRVIAFSVVDGQRLWERDVPLESLDSRASPAFDAARDQVLIGSGNRVNAIAADDGDLLWQRQLSRSIANASLCVTQGLTRNGVPADRAYITDYDGFQTRSSLYAINVSPYDAWHNPFQPGEIAWKAAVGRAAGSSPAYADGRVFVATGKDDVYAFDALDPPPDPNHPGLCLPEWKAEVAVPGASPDSGFFGPCSVSGGAVFAATYEFVGSQNAGRLVKLDAADGHAHWNVPAERTGAGPIPLSGGVLLSGGIDGFGSKIKLQAFADDGYSTALEWDTQDGDSVAPEMGGWTHQPAVARRWAYIGSPDPNSPGGEDFGAYGILSIVNLKKEPDDADFVVDRHYGAGGSPALAYGRLFSIGTAGLFAFDPSPACAADVSGNGLVDLDDLLLLLGAYGDNVSEGDAPWDVEVDLDGDVDLDDLLAMLGVFGAACGSCGGGA